MVSSLVQFRHPSQELEFLRKQGINPNLFAKQVFETAVDELRRKERADRINEARKWVAEAQKRRPLGMTITQLIRQGRDQH